MTADKTIALAREGYLWASRVRNGRPAAPTRLLGKPAIVVGGPDGVRRFYDPRLRRRRAVPAPIKLVLFGPRAVHGLDDDAHHRRKSYFTELLTANTLRPLAQRADEQWRQAISAWPVGETHPIFPLAVDTIARTVLPWAGLPLDDHRTLVRGRQLTGVVDGFARPVQPYLRAAAERARLDGWAARMVRAVRTGELEAPQGSALAAVAHHGDPDELLPAKVAGVELLNVIRPAQAAAWFVAFGALALQQHPELRDQVANDQRFRWAFAQEVRRFYPFVPALAARPRFAQDILGHHLNRSGMVILDVYGTNHDPETWGDPEVFRPQRFVDGPIPDDGFVPQGGGSVADGHRCPGEDVVLIMVSSALLALAENRFDLPPQDTDWPVSPLPTLPRSGVRLRRLSDF